MTRPTGASDALNSSLATHEAAARLVNPCRITVRPLETRDNQAKSRSQALAPSRAIRTARPSRANARVGRDRMPAKTDPGSRPTNSFNSSLATHDAAARVVNPCRITVRPPETRDNQAKAAVRPWHRRERFNFPARELRASCQKMVNPLLPACTALDCDDRAGKIFGATPTSRLREPGAPRLSLFLEGRR